MKLVILDRDGVINQDSDDYIKSVEEWIAIDGSIEAIARLNQAGYNIVVASNQSGIARGYFTISTLNAMHEKMHELVQLAGGHIDGVFFCPHAPSDQCEFMKLPIVSQYPWIRCFLSVIAYLTLKLQKMPMPGRYWLEPGKAKSPSRI